MEAVYALIIIAVVGNDVDVRIHPIGGQEACESVLTAGRALPEWGERTAKRNTVMCVPPDTRAVLGR